MVTNFMDSFLSGYFRSSPGKSKVEACGGHPQLRFLAKCLGSVCVRLSHCEMLRWQLKTAVFSSQELMCNNVTLVNITVLLYLKFDRG